jgi:anti-sigma regulatory factor (Ser/Thr protein kinase)
MHIALEMELLPRPGTPRAARHALREALHGLDRRLLEDAELLLSELITNAARHAGGRSTILLRIGLLSPGLRLEISDGSATLPRPRSAAAGDDTGRGLAVVEALADDWGVVPVPGDGKTVWCELRSGAAEPRLPTP